MAAPSPREARSPASHIRLGFAVAALLDAGANLALRPIGKLGVRLAAVALAALHILAIGLVLSALVALADRLLPPRRGLRPAVALLFAFAAGWGIFIDDFSVFPLPLRTGLTLGAAAPFAVLVAVWPLVARSRLLAAVACAVAIALVLGNHFGLDASYPGVHLATHLATGLSAALGLAGLRIPTPPLPARWLRGLSTALLAVACLAASTALVVWPSNAVLVTQSRLPTAALVPFLARVHIEEAATAAAKLDREARSWFEPRTGLPPVPPTSPPLFRGKPLVIFLTVDALRSDVVLGDAEDVVAATPNLRALASRGASFTMARSTASSTSPATSSIFLGKHYSSLYWTEQAHLGKTKFFLSQETSPRFPEILAERGVESAFVPSATGFLTEYGITRGMKPLAKKVAAGTEHAAPMLRRWIDGAGKRPGMVWAHLLDPHDPYIRGPKGAAPFARYLGEVAYVDEEIGKLVAHVEDKKLASRVFFIITADHGEAFGEHGTKTHASTVYEEQVRVPLIVVGPGVRPRAIAEPVSVIDLGATIMDIFGVETPGHWMGESLVPLLAGKDVRLTRPIVLDAGRRKQGIVSRDGVKAIRNLRHKTREVYDLAADPDELENLVETRPDFASEHLGVVSTFFHTHELRRHGYVVPYRD